MSLKPEGINPVPEETARIAHAAYPKGNVFMHMRDELGRIYEDENFADLFSHTGQPAEAPRRLALVTIMQFSQGLSDQQAADAVRGRIDWKYALGLELADPGFDASVLSEFRTRLVEGHAEERLLTVMLTLFKERGWLKARGKQRTDSTHVLAKIRAINRLVCVGETLRHALNCLAIVAPEWLLERSQSEWVDRDAGADGRLAAAFRRTRASSLGSKRWARWSEFTWCPLWVRCPFVVGASTSSRDFTARVGPELSVQRRQAELAFLGEHPACRLVHQFTV